MVLARIPSETDRKRPLFQAISGHKSTVDIVTHHPIACRRPDVPHFRSVLWIVRQLKQRPPTAVVVHRVVEIDDALTLHVRLPSQDEDKDVGLRVLSLKISGNCQKDYGQPNRVHAAPFQVGFKQYSRPPILINDSLTRRITRLQSRCCPNLKTRA